MNIIKLEHSGIVVEKEGKNIVFDPVEFTEKLPYYWTSSLREYWGNN